MRTKSRHRQPLRRRGVKRRRLIDYPRQGKCGARRWIPSWRLILGTLLTFACTVLGLFTAVYWYVDIPDMKAAARQEANVYYWSDGTQMVSVGAVNRQNVPLSRVPVAVREAVLAAENASFYSDSGVSPTGILRAAVNMVGGQEAQGGSTITQQYVKNTYLSQEQTVTRKVKEFFIAMKLDRRKSKDDILEGYLNTSWFGRGAYGIQAASHAWFGTDVAKLNPSQGAYLAALLKGGDLYDPSLGKSNRKRAVERWSWILDREVELGFMTARERATYTDFPMPRTQSLATNLSGQTGYLVDIAKRYLKKQANLTEADLARGGYQIHTTFNKHAVRELQKSVQKTLQRDIDPKKRMSDRHVEVGAASVRPSDGAILAIYGGADATKHFANNADTSGVPAGSAFKPFVLAAALQQGIVAPNGTVLPVSIDSFYGKTGHLVTRSPLLSHDSSQAVPLPPGVPSLRDALVASGNVTFKRLGADVGLRNVENFAVEAGMLRTSMAHRTAEFPLGTSTPSAIRMADAYGTFASGGLRHEPYSVTKVLRDYKSVPGLERTEAQRVMDENVAREMTSVLQDAAARASATTADTVGRIAGAATGRNEIQRVAWFAGYTDRLSTAVTMFRSLPGKPLLPLTGTGGEKSVRGSVLPTRIWADYMSKLTSAADTGGRPEQRLR